MTDPSVKIDNEKAARPALSSRQLKILRWLDENPSYRARWLVNGRAPKPTDTPDMWDAMEIAGERGSIRIDAADLDALRDLKTVSPSPDKMYGITDEARALIAKAAQR